MNNLPFPSNVALEIFGEEIDLPTDFEGTFLYVVKSKLKQRESTVLLQRYQEKMTLEEVGRRHNVTRERIRQIEVKALRKLRYPAHSKLMRNGLKKWTDTQISLAAEAAAKAERFRIETFEMQEDGDLVKVEESKTPDALRAELEDLDLSVRSYNCLKRAGCQTLGDVVAKGQGIYKIRNLGKKSAEEIFRKIESYGISTESMRVES